MRFGTAGLRGEMGLGSAYMNHYTIQRVSLAFAQFLQEQFSAKDLVERGIVIGHDNRHHSAEFCQKAAAVLTAAQIKVWLFHEPTPTPIVSYMTQALQAAGGIVITASHNPQQYNGFKIYNEQGAQYLPNATDVIGRYYDVITTKMFAQIEADESLISFVPASYRDDYFQAVRKMQFYRDEPKHLKIVYSNFHGTGQTWTPALLKSCGYEVIIVQEQYEYDPDFTTVPSPNPEILSNYDYCLQYAQKYQADLIIVNDPDADRIGIGVRTKTGVYQLLNGNETGPILLDYWLRHHQQSKIMPPHPTMYNTFVTSHLSDLVAQKYHVACKKTLTGFKWIAAMIDRPQADFVFGFEEAYGYVLNPIVRDKDGIQSALMLAEACYYYRQHHFTFVDVLEQLYAQFGYFFCHTYIEQFEPMQAQAAMQQILQQLRSDHLTKLGSWQVVKVEDYLDQLYDMPAQDLLKFYFHDGSWLAVRGSGTEPKMKFYYVSVHPASLTAAQAQLKQAHASLLRLLNLRGVA